MDHLLVAENYLGTSLTSHDQVRDIFTKLSRRQLLDLVDAYAQFDKNWTPPQCVGKDTLLIGRAYDTIGNPHSWLPRMQDKLLARRLDAAQIHRLLIYAPSLGIWIPDTYSEYREASLSLTDFMIKDLGEFVSLLTGIRQYLRDGSVTLFPDKFYADTCQWKGGNVQSEGSGVPPSEMLVLARTEAKDPAYREILSKLNFISDETESMCSESTYLRALREWDDIYYVNPLNEINEDIAIQAIAGASIVCANSAMFELVAHKLGDEAISTSETTWSTLSATLPRINDVSIADLASIRANEEAFAIWRTALRETVWKWESELQKRGKITPAEAENIFNQTTLPIRMTIENKIKARSLKSIIESGGVSFCTGAIAASTLSLEPLSAIATGAVSSSLKIAYDIIKARNAKTDRGLLRVFTRFGGI